MCGIVGFISNNGAKGWPSDRVKYIKQGLVVDTLRGYHSTGVFTVREGEENKTAYWEKDATTGSEFVCTSDFEKLVSKPSEFRYFIGHNRAATLGEVNVDNAHPFQEGDITLVHNGTLTSTHGMPLPMSLLDDVDVDSHAICHNLAEHDIAEWYKNMYGAWALIWHDARDGSLNIVRNHQRPLAVGKVTGEETLLIASESEMLEFLANRISIQLTEVYTLETDIHFKWTKDTPVLQPITRKLERWYSSYDDDDLVWGRYSHAGRQRASGGGGAATADPFPKPDGKVLVGGQWQEVPKQLQIDLMDFDLEPQDRTSFSPWRVVEEGDTKGKKRLTVYGWLGRAGTPAIVHGVLPSLKDSLGSSHVHNWTVQPVGVYRPDIDVEKENVTREIVVCNFIRSTPPVANTPPAPTHYSSKDMVVGPGGVYITEESYLHMTKDGCAICAKPIDVLDDIDIEWSDERKPICLICQNKMMEVAV